MLKLIAYYLPQFHAIPENDAWWGSGFTEWHNVRRARPRFSGHNHPRVPGELGYYDLNQDDVRVSQSRLAREFGIDAFCMYFYWFDGHRLLEKPLERWRQDETLLPYCLSWANEAWTRRWDGKNEDVLMPQTYPPGFADDIFLELRGHFEAAHYLRHEGKPVLVVHRVELIPEPAKFAARIRELALQQDIGPLYLVAAETTAVGDPSSFGFDAVAEFPPVGSNTLSNVLWTPLTDVSRAFRGRLMSFARMSMSFSRRRGVDYVRHRGVMPGWDNTARRADKATIYVGSTPNLYERWLNSAIHAENAERPDNGLVFINAWNEWAEGAYLEPDETNGRAYLEATLAAKESRPMGERPGADVPPSARFWSRGQLHSIALAFAGSCLAGLRRMRRRMIS